VLCEVAARLCSSVRQTDTVARLGGDEFIVLLPDLHFAVEAESIAAMIVSAVAEPIDIENTKVHISVSVGVCTSPDQTPMRKNFYRVSTRPCTGQRQPERTGTRFSGMQKIELECPYDQRILSCGRGPNQLDVFFCDFRLNLPRG
jgi:hypothetical protein